MRPHESVLFAFRNAMRIIVMVSAFTLFLLTTHPSELMSDLTRRGLPGQFAYVIISTLQILPQMIAKSQTIISAQRSRGLDTESSFLKRAGALVPLIGPLVFGSLVEVEERAIAIEARGFTSKHAKTSLHEIPDTPFDKSLRLGSHRHHHHFIKPMAFVNLQNVTYKYPLTKTPVLQNINLQVNEGEFVAVMGPNGAGKSTLCYALAGFVPHFFKGEISGRIEVDGKESRSPRWMNGC
jgi:ABC-type multidrug transport system fused ATPase/permease subunit